MCAAGPVALLASPSRAAGPAPAHPLGRSDVEKCPWRPGSFSGPGCGLWVGSGGGPCPSAPPPHPGEGPPGAPRLFPARRVEETGRGEEGVSASSAFSALLRALPPGADGREGAKPGSPFWKGGIDRTACTRTAWVPGLWAGLGNSIGSDHGESLPTNPLRGFFVACWPPSGLIIFFWSGGEDASKKVFRLRGLCLGV